MFKRYQYRIETEFDTPEFRRELDKIAQDESEVMTSLKEDTTASVWRAEYQSRPLLIKRYNTRGTWHAIRRSLRQSRADNCRIMTSLFTQAGIYVAPNIAVIQEWFGPFKLRSWFICEFIPGEMLIHYFANHSDLTYGHADLETIESNVDKLFESLRRHHLSHGDLKASNILLSEDRLYLIDLDAARAHKNKISFQRAHKKDQSRFMKNWLQQAKIHQIFEPLINQKHPNQVGKYV